MSVIKSVDILTNSNKQNHNTNQSSETKIFKQGKNKLSSQQLAQVNNNISLNNSNLIKEQNNPAATVSISRSGYNLMLRSIERLKESGKEFQIAKLVIPKSMRTSENTITNFYRKMIDIFA